VGFGCENQIRARLCTHFLRVRFHHLEVGGFSVSGHLKWQSGRSNDNGATHQICLAIVELSVARVQNFSTVLNG